MKKAIVITLAVLIGAKLALHEPEDEDDDDIY